MREALKAIADMHLPDQPMTSDLDERAYAMQHIGRMREIARRAYMADHHERHLVAVIAEERTAK